VSDTTEHDDDHAFEAECAAWQVEYKEQLRERMRTHCILGDEYKEVEAERDAALAKVAELETARPHVTADETGGVVLEWWRGTRKLTVYLNHADYVKVWGPDVNTEMETDELTGANAADVWAWLHEAQGWKERGE
jgi:hypothetical protein